MFVLGCWQLASSCKVSRPAVLLDSPACSVHMRCGNTLHTGLSSSSAGGEIWRVGILQTWSACVVRRIPIGQSTGLQVTRRRNGYTSWYIGVLDCYWHR